MVPGVTHALFCVRVTPGSGVAILPFFKFRDQLVFLIWFYCFLLTPNATVTGPHNAHARCSGEGAAGGLAGNGALHPDRIAPAHGRDQHATAGACQQLHCLAFRFQQAFMHAAGSFFRALLDRPAAIGSLVNRGALFFQHFDLLCRVNQGPQEISSFSFLSRISLRRRCCVRYIAIAGVVVIASSPVPVREELAPTCNRCCF